MVDMENQPSETLAIANGNINNDNNDAGTRDEQNAQPQPERLRRKAIGERNSDEQEVHSELDVDHDNDCDEPFELLAENERLRRQLEKLTRRKDRKRTDTSEDEDEGKIRSSFKVNVPIRFGGTAKESADFDNWRREVRDYLDFNRVRGKTAVRQMFSLFTGEAQDWYYLIRNEYEEPEELLQAIRDHFNVADVEQEAYDSLFQLRGREREIAGYNRKFVAVTRHITSKNLTEGGKLQHYMRGLPPSIHAGLQQPTKPQTLEEAMKRAAALDRAWTTSANQTRSHLNQQRNPPANRGRGSYEYNQSRTAYVIDEEFCYNVNGERRPLDGNRRPPFQRQQTPAARFNPKNNNNNLPAKRGRCYVCNDPNHYARDCPKKKNYNDRELRVMEEEWERVAQADIEAEFVESVDD